MLLRCPHLAVGAEHIFDILLAHAGRGAVEEHLQGGEGGVACGARTKLSYAGRRRGTHV